MLTGCWHATLSLLSLYALWHVLGSALLVLWGVGTLAPSDCGIFAIQSSSSGVPFESSCIQELAMLFTDLSL